MIVEMKGSLLTHCVITDYVTGRSVIDTGPEANRQKVERYLVEEKRYAKTDIIVDMALSLVIDGKPYHSRLDLVVMTKAGPVMVIKCAAGSLDSREREIIYAARVALEKPVPIAIASDGQTALVYDALSRKPIGEGMEAIPSPEQALQIIAAASTAAIPPERREKEKIIFRSYDNKDVTSAGSGC
jgi:hypothetical protein